MTLFVSPCSGCCYRSAVSGGSCSACSLASSPCGNRRSWGPSGYQGNGPAEACSETSSQMDWQVGRHKKPHYCYHLTQERCQKETRKKGGKKDTQTESWTEMKAGGPKHTDNTSKITQTTDIKITDEDQNMHQVRSKQKQRTFKKAMMWKPHYFVKWMQSLMNTPPEPCYLLLHTHFSTWSSTDQSTTITYTQP